MNSPFRSAAPQNCPELNMSMMLLKADLEASSEITGLIIVLLVLQFLYSVNSGAMSAFFQLSAKDIQLLKTRNQPSGRQVLQLLRNPRKLMANLRVASVFLSIAIIIGTHVLVQLLFPELSLLSHILIQLIVVTLFLVLFGAVLPKVYAAQEPMKMATFSAPIAAMMFSLFRPVSRGLESSHQYIDSDSVEEDSLSTEELEHAIEMTLGHPATAEEVNIFRSIMKFGRTTVRQIMKTRLDVKALEYHLSYREVQRRLLEYGLSRMPVYQGSLDNIVGMILSKDFLPYSDRADLDWHSLIRPAYFVPEGKLIDDLLVEFRQNKVHFAIVVDEFGGSSGIVTMEDIMEEIIGEIKDEFDTDDLDYKKIDDHTYIFEGKTLIHDVCRILNIPTGVFSEVRGESDSLGGLILEICGKFPAINESVRYGQFEFLILEMGHLRISKVKLTDLSKQSPPPGSRP